MLVLGLRTGAALPPRLIRDSAGAEGIPTRHQTAARRPAQRRRITGLEAHSGLGQRVNVWRLGFADVGTVAADTVDSHIVGQNEDDVGLVGCWFLVLGL